MPTGVTSGSDRHQSWGNTLARPELSGCVIGAIVRQRQVVMLRDVEGLTSSETCSALGISSGNQRILLHRGRSSLRGILEAKMDNRL
jgi:DNA-directed RNA polymerase specialized sigma24 family protein